MPAISANIVRLSLGYLVVGATIGALLLLNRASGIADWIWLVRPVHFEFLLFGWFFQLAFGVASWILPRTTPAPPRARLLSAIVLLNAGILFSATGQVTSIDVVLLIGRATELGGVATFATYIWPRVREIKPHGH